VMEMVRHNIVYDLLQKTKLSSNSVNLRRYDDHLDDHQNSQNDKILQRANQVYFAICNSCYWCASYLEFKSASSPRVLDCHVCNSHTELIPISTDKSFRIELAN
jgi:hypothetical protein